MNENDFMLIDSHCHLGIMQKKGLNIGELLENAQRSNFKYILDIGVNVDDLPERFALAKNYNFVLHSVGLYPSWSEKDFISELQTLETYLTHEKVVALGEFGLDYHWNFSTKLRQKELFIKQIEIANRYHLPVIIHTRDADRDTADILQRHKVENGGVIHCCSSQKDFVRRFLDTGFHISFAGNITYKNANNLRDSLSLVPMDRLLLETDAPYLSPQKKRGMTNTPLHIPYIYEYVAEQKRLSLCDLSVQLVKNFETVFINLQGK